MTAQHMIFVFMALGAGALLPIQGGVNGHLAKVLGSPFLASFVSGAVAFFCLTVMLFFTGGLKGLAGISEVPLWNFVGGLCGVTYLFMIVVAAPRLGATGFTIAVICGQMVVAVVLDQFALAGFAYQPINTARIIGVLLVIAGVVVTQIASTSR